MSITDSWGSRGHLDLEAKRSPDALHLAFTAPPVELRWASESVRKAMAANGEIRRNLAEGRGRTRSHPILRTPQMIRNGRDNRFICKAQFVSLHLPSGYRIYASHDSWVTSDIDEIVCFNVMKHMKHPTINAVFKVWERKKANLPLHRLKWSGYSKWMDGLIVYNGVQLIVERKLTSSIWRSDNWWGHSAALQKCGRNEVRLTSALWERFVAEKTEELRDAFDQAVKEIHPESQKFGRCWFFLLYCITLYMWMYIYIILYYIHIFAGIE